MNKPKPPPPKLSNPSNSKKFLELIKNVQPGTCVDVKGEVEFIIRRAKWDGLMYNLKKQYFIHLIGGFYCNMNIIKGVEGILNFTTTVNRKVICVDNKSINRALHLPLHLCELPCEDIYFLFVFNKSEFELMVCIFCNSDMLDGLCDVNCGIHFKHFTSTFQHLALIIRSNVMPKPNQSKYLDFFDMKIMHLLFNNKINFSISYVILLNMINAHLVDYMTYGMLISSLFAICNIPMPEIFANLADSQITNDHFRPQVPLMHCEPQEVTPIVIPQFIREEDVFLSKFESVKAMFNEPKMEFKRVKTENDELKEKVGEL
ncbi:uncharacterized protein LOC141711337 [Apium graveolens]|uniref:uncharacterized protein LOC141711337 n=1 Tax=Apium graveolens TaxID=4045 RepID=UPI003D78F2F3